MEQLAKSQHVAGFLTTPYGQETINDLRQKNIDRQLNALVYDPALLWDEANRWVYRLQRERLLSWKCATEVIAELLSPQDRHLLAGLTPLDPYEIPSPEPSLLQAMQKQLAEVEWEMGLAIKNALAPVLVDHGRLRAFINRTIECQIPRCVHTYGGGELTTPDLAHFVFRHLTQMRGMDAPLATLAAGLWMYLHGDVETMPEEGFWSEALQRKPVHVADDFSVSDVSPEDNETEEAFWSGIEAVKRYQQLMVANSALLHHRSHGRAITWTWRGASTLFELVHKLLGSGKLTLGSAGGSEDLQAHNHDRKALVDALKVLQEGNEKALRESGEHPLRLAFGFLNYEGRRAPLLLLHCRLQANSRDGRWSLSAENSEIAINTALIQKLQDWGIPIAAIDEDSSNPGAWFAALKKVLAKCPQAEEWLVDEVILLDLFHIENQALLDDLDRRRWQRAEISPAANPLARMVMLGGTYDEESLPGAEDIDQARISGRLRPISPMDDSQVGSLVALDTHENLVVYGPPGTGKSTVIQNMAARYAAEGQRVLVVSKKPAALEVLLRRLDTLGLRDVVLPLFGDHIRGGRLLHRIEKRIGQETIDLEAQGISHQPQPCESTRQLVQHQRRMSSVMPGDTRTMELLCEQTRKREEHLTSLWQQINHDEPFPDIRVDLEKASAYQGSRH